MKVKIKKNLKRFLLILFGLIVVFLFESVSFFFLSDSKLTIPEALSVICQQEPLLLWRQRANLKTTFQDRGLVTNALGLRGRQINKSKGDNTHRIICLGASPTFGWGVEENNTYPYLLEEDLNKGKNTFVEVINAGQIGYTSYQGKILLKNHLLEYSPDLITVSYVLNDIDRCRFFRNEKAHDNELKLLPVWRIMMQNMITKSRMYLLAKRSIVNILQKNKLLFSDILRNQCENIKIRVKADQYRDNLEQMIVLAKKNNIKVIFVVMPVHLIMPKIKNEDQMLIKKASSLSALYYEKGCFSQEENDYKRAVKYFRKALNYQIFQCQEDALRYQQIMKEVARNYDIPLVDASWQFKNNADKLKLFNGPQDPIHPSARGHDLIAELLHKKILQQDFLMHKD